MADKNVGIRVEPEEYDRIQAQWKQAGFKSLQEAGLHALRTSFAPDPEADIPAKYRPYLKILAEVLASGNENLIELVVTPLKYAQKRIRPDEQRKDDR